MPRIRSIKPEFFKDEDLCEYPPWVRILFEGLWIQADREGRLEDRPKKIGAEIFPYDKFDVDKGLQMLCSPKKYSPKHEPFIVRYSVDGEKYIQIMKFLKHQVPHHTEKESIIPALTVIPQDNSNPTPGVLLEHSGYTGDAPESEQITMNLNRISYKEGEWGGIEEKDITLWKEAYPACDIEAELRKMSEWIKANPSKGKKFNYRRFIVNWLNRTQDKGGTKGQVVKTDKMDAHVKKMQEEWEKEHGNESI